MGSWQDTKHPHVFLKFETAALCEAGLSDLNVPKRQRPRWRVEVVDDTRLKLSYDDLIETCHHYMTNSIVKPYLGTQACKILAPDDAEKRPKRPPLEQTLSQTLGQAQALPRTSWTRQCQPLPHPARRGPTHPQPLAGPPLRCM